MFNVHCFFDDTRIGGGLYEHLPRVGDLMRFDYLPYGKVTEVIWCMDESKIDGQRVNLRIESLERLARNRSKATT